MDMLTATALSPVAGTEHPGEAVGVCITDATGNVVWCNEMMECITGYSLAELMNRKPGQLLQGPLTNPETVEYLHKQQQLIEPFECTILNYHKDGTPYWSHLTGQPIKDAAGRLLHYVARQQSFPYDPAKPQFSTPASNVTNGVLTAIQSELLFSNLLLGYVVVNRKGIITTVNEALSRIFQLPKALQPEVGTAAEHLFQHINSRLDASSSLLPLGFEETASPAFITEQQLLLRNGTTVLYNRCCPADAVSAGEQIWWFKQLPEQTATASRISGIQELLAITNKAAQIGSWQLDLERKELYWSDVTKAIHEVPADFVPQLETAIDFYKPGTDRDRLVHHVEQCLQYGTPFDLEVELITAKGTHIWVRSLGAAETRNGQITKIFGSIQNVTDKHQLLQQLELSNQRYAHLFNQNPHVVFALDTNGRFTDINDAGLELAQVDRDTIMQLTFRDFAEPAYLDLCEQALQAALQGETPTIQVAVRNLKGQRFYLEITDIPFRINGQIAGLFGIAKDITGEVEIKEKLRISEERVQLAMYSASDGIWDWLIPEDKAYFSPRFLEMVGYEGVDDHEYLPGTTTLFRVLHPDDLEPMRQHFFEHAKYRVPFQYECRVNTKEGAYRWFLLRGQAKWDDTGYAYRMTGSFSDIHLQKVLSEELTRSNNRFLRAVEGANDFVRESDLLHPENNFISERLFERLGYHKEQYQANPSAFYESLIHPEDRQHKDDARRKHFEGQRPTYETQFRLRVADGSYRWFRSRAKATWNREGQPILLTGSISEIHEQKMLEESLRESQQLYALAVAGSRDAIWDYNLVTGQRDMSNRVEEMLGFSRQEVLTPGFMDNLVHPDDSTARAQALEDHLCGRKPFYQAEFRIKHKSGRYLWFLSRGKAIMNERGEPVRITGSLTDIQHQKQLQQELVVMNHKLQVQQVELQRLLSLQQATLDALPDKVFKIRKDGTITFIHIPPTAVLFRKQVPVEGQNLYQFSSWSQSIQLWIAEADADAMLVREFESVQEDGHYHFEARITQAGNDEFLLVIRNVTDRKRAEKELVKNELKYTSLMENMQIGLLEVDNNEIIQHAHPRFCQMVGYTNQELVGKSAHELLSVVTDEQLRKDILQKRQQGVSSIYEKAIRKKNGDLLHVLISGTPITNDKGEVVGSVGIHYDISDQKKTEQLLEEAKQAGRIGYFEIDLEKRKISWDRTTRNIYEVDDQFEPTLESGISFYKPGGSRERMEAVVQNAIIQGLPVAEDFEITTARNNSRWIKIVARVQMRNGKPALIAGLTIDITESKLAEQTIRQYLAFNETVISSIQDGFYMLDSEWRLVFVNDVACNYIHKSRSELLGQNVWEVLPQEKARFFTPFEDVKTSKVPMSMMTVHEVAGEKFWLEINVYPTREDGITVLFRDITSIKRVEEANMALQDRYEAVVNNTNQIVYEWDLVDDHISFNDVFYRLTGYPRESKIATGAFCLTCVHPDDIEVLKEKLTTTLAAPDKPFVVDYRFRINNGRYRHMHTKGVLSVSNEGKPLRVLGTIEDITDRVRLTEQLIKQKVTTQRKISEASINIQEKERAFIGKELHDNVNQILTTATLYLQMAAGEGYRTAATIEGANQLIKDAIEEIRGISRRLAPPALKDIGLSSALADLISTINKASSIEISFEDLSDPQIEIDSDISLVIYRICQELLNNAVKYSEASHCKVQLYLSRYRLLRLTVTDDGKGFDTTKVKKGIGLSGTVERVELYNGMFDIKSTPGAGCCITVEIKV